MKNLLTIGNKRLLISAKAFFGGMKKVAYKIAPYKPPTFDSNDIPYAVAFKINGKVYYGEAAEGEVMHILLMINLPDDEQKILADLSEENDEVTAGFFTQGGCFYNRDQCKEFFGFRHSQEGLKSTKEKMSKQKPSIDVDLPITV